MVVERTFWHERLERAWTHRSIVWLSGVRRVGKTVLCRTLPDVEYFDCELPSVRRQIADPEAFLETVRGKRVVLDEVHRLDRPSELLKIAADHHPDTKVVATGSSTLAASRKFSDTLTGRKTEVRLTPMMSADMDAFGGGLEDRLWWGGLPPFFLQADEVPESDYQEWMDSYWSRDIQTLFRIQQRAAFLRFTELVLAASGGMFEATTFAGPSEVSRTTIANFLSILQATGVASVVRPYSTRRSTEIVSAPKVYGFDTGFVRYHKGWTQRRPDDLGVLWEHYVLNEIHACLPEAEVRYWRDKQHHEVDFVVLRRGAAPVAVECKLTAANAGDLAGLRAFRRAYPEGENLVVCADVERLYAGRAGDLKVRYVGLAHMIAEAADVPGRGSA